MAPQHPMVGKKYGNYAVRSLLGEGGMGAVFLAEHAFLGDRVAIKVLHGTYAGNPTVCERFFQEAKSAREIGHPSIIRILDFGQSDDGGLYLIMELLEGQTLTALLRAGRPEERVAARIGAEIADGLAAAHARGIIHRDLKPDNIFLVGGGVKILDFGIAKVLNSAGRTGTGTMLGTPRYMAPEQAKGAKFVGPFSDVYSLGVMLFEMVTGRAPFEAGDMTELLAKILLDTPPRPSELATLSAPLDELISRSLAKNPAERPSGMIEVRDRLLAIADGTPISLSHTKPTMPVLVPSPTTLSSGVGEMASRTHATAGDPRRRRTVAAIAGATVLAGLAVGGAAWFAHGRSRATPTPAAPTTTAEVETRPPPRAPSPPKPVAVAPPAEVAPPPRPAPVARPAARVRVESQPAGARVQVGDREAGVTPLALEVTLPQEITLRLDGYQTARQLLVSPGPARVVLARHKHLEAPASHPPARPAKPAPRSPADVSLD